MHIAKPIFWRDNLDEKSIVDLEPDLFIVSPLAAFVLSQNAS
jgi:hypothetical protein